VRKLHAAVIGAGRLGGLHAQKLARLESVDLVAVVDPVESRRNRLAAECRTKALADYRPLLGQIDAAVVAAPSEVHHPIALELLNWGTHVLVEKPLCLTAAEADQLVHVARRNGAVLQVGHVERFNPALAPALGLAGHPKYIEAVRAGPFTFRSTDIGVVLDLMIHDLDLALAMVRSRVRRIDALGLSVLGGHEDAANARLEFECGCVAALSASRVSDQPARRMQVWSPQGFAAIDFAARKTTLVRPSETLLRRELKIDAIAAGDAPDRDAVLQEHLRREEIEFAPVDAIALELDDFVQSIRGSRPPRVTGEAGRDAVALAERILERIQAHAWDEQTDGPVGPMATARPSVIPAPHVKLALAPLPMPRREAG
jgi:predicted dehydrogenase